jgi:transposase, IS5 family
MMASNPWREGFEAIMFRTVNDQPTLWDSILPPELLVLPVELGRVDALLQDPVFFAPFATYFDARIGRPSIPMETYLRLMFPKFRYRLGYESLCREVSDSISWQWFCRIPFGTRVPHPTTLMKITTRCGDDAVTGLNEALLAKAAAAKLLRTDKVRADTTVVEAAVAYPTDSGLLAKAIGSMARTVVQIKATGGATRTRSRDRRRSAGRRARSIAAKLKLRGEQQRDAAQAAVRRITGAAVGEATAVIRNARRALRSARGHRKAQLHRAINRLDTLVGYAERVVAQTRSRLGGVMPESASRVVSLHDVDARPIRKGRLGKPVEFGYKAQIVDNADGVILDHNVEIGNPADAPQLAPAIARVTARTGHTPRAVTADRGYGQASVEHDLHELGVRSVAIPPTSKPSAARREFEHRRAFREKVKWRTGSEGRINHMNAATAGTAPNSPASTEPEPGADTVSSPTTSSRSAPSQHETTTPHR